MEAGDMLQYQGACGNDDAPSYVLHHRYTLIKIESKTNIKHFGPNVLMVFRPVWVVAVQA